jgi:hypothetical protein
MGRAAKSGILVPAAKLSRRTVVVIASGYNPPVDISHQFLVDRLVLMQLRDPSVGDLSRARVSASGGGVLKGKIELKLRELGAFNLSVYFSIISCSFPGRCVSPLRRDARRSNTLPERINGWFYRAFRKTDSADHRRRHRRL